MAARGQENGQALVEFALIASILFMLTVGLVDVGRAFYQYQAVSSAARYGARWGAIVGGACGYARRADSSDWCNRVASGSVTGDLASDFFNQCGNFPPTSATCPGTVTSSISSCTSNSYYSYRPSSYNSATATNIVGAIARRVDSDSSHSNLVRGGLLPGLSLSRMQICVQILPSSDYFASTSTWHVNHGDFVRVTVWYPFTPVGGLFRNAAVNLQAVSQYQVE